MKVHKNQWLWDGPYSPDHLSGALSRGHTMAPEGQTPSQRPEMGPPHSGVDLQPLENKALSWGIIRKSACILAAITIRKSQYLGPRIFRGWSYPHIVPRVLALSKTIRRLAPYRVIARQQWP